MKWVFFICFLAVTFILPALDPGKAIANYNIKIWDMAGGLPGNSIIALRQTSDGYLWIGTQDGLVRFDGVHFEVFTVEKVPMLKSNDIRALYEDRNGVLWIGTSTGGFIRFKDGEFFAYPAVENNALSSIKSIAEDAAGNLWIGSYANLTCLMNGQFTTYTTKNGFTDNPVPFIYQDENRDLWVTTYSWIAKIIKPGVFEKYASQDVLPYLKTAALYESRTGELWIGTGEGGLFNLKNGTVLACEIGAGIRSSAINTLYKDKQENLWIGTDGGGLLRLNKDDGLNCGSVYAITEDNEGSLWVGTLDRGLFQLRDSKFITYTVGEGLSHNFVRCIYEDRDNATWIGTDGGLNRIKNGKITTVLTTGEGLLNNTVTCLCEDAAGNLWIGTWGGLHMFKAGKLTTFTGRNGLSDTRIKCIFHDKWGNAWIGTENGLNRYDPVTGKFEVFAMEQGASGNSIQFIYEDARGQLWVGANNGINQLREGKISAYPLPLGEVNFSLQCFYEDKDGMLLFGTDRGLIRLRGGVFDRLTEDDVCTIQEDGIGYLWLGGRKGISRIAVKELTEFVPGKSRPVYVEIFDEVDGLKSSWVIGVGCRTRDGRLWFATSMGAAVIEPGRIKKETRTLSPIIEKLIVDGENIRIKSFGGGPGPRGAGGLSGYHKKDPLAAGGSLELSPGKKRLDIYYTAVSFIDPQGIRFRIKLEGYDDDWVDVGGQRNAVYNGLLPGRYTFKVATYNYDGTWSAESAVLSFYLRPYFYQTVWFYLLLFIVVSLSVYTGHRLRVKQIKDKARELGELVKQRTYDLEVQKLELENAHHVLQQTNELIETKNRQLEDQSEQLKELDKARSRFFDNITHEFRTPLTLIIGPLEQILTENHDTKIKSTAGLMLRSSKRLLNLVNQLLDLAKFDSGKLKLHFGKQDIVSFLKSIFYCFESLARQNSIEFTFVCEESEMDVFYDSESLERVVTNLLGNSFKYTQQGGRITVSLRKVPVSGEFPCGSVEITVENNGPGIPGDQLPYIFDRFYRGDGSEGFVQKGAGIGLALSKELVELHHGRIEVQSNCREDENRGVCFTVCLPLGGGHLKAEEKVEMKGSHISSSELIDILTEAGLENQNQAPGGVDGVHGEAKDIVLVVEDNAETRRYIRNVLEPGFKIEEAGDGREGVSKAREIIPDLIIADVMMPGMDGCELCKALKSDIITSHIPVILLTARTGEADILKGLSYGADDYITKPFNVRALTARVRNLISLRHQLQLERKNRMRFQPGEIPISLIDDEFYKKLQETLAAHLSDADFNVDVLSRVMQMSQPTLYRKIQALTGKTPTSFIRSYRLKRAAELLTAAPGLSIAQAAAEVGFSDFSYFSRCFKEHFHCLPSDIQSAGGSRAAVKNDEKLLPGVQGGGFLEKSPPGQEIILVVEDNEDARQYIRESLESKYKVFEAADGKEGIARAIEIVPDLVISDIMMSGMDGYELCRVLKNDIRTSHIPIVLLTAKASQESIIQGLETGADDYIIKPFNLKILMARIENLLRLRRHLQQGREREMALLPVKIIETDIDREFINELEAEMGVNFSDSEFNVEQLANKLYMSRLTLYRKILAIYGETPTEFMRSYRLKRGAQLLEKGLTSVLEVALEVGFPNSSYFAKCFKDVFHQSPYEYKVSKSNPAAHSAF